MTLEILLMLAVISIGLVAYRLGHVTGYDEGHDHGYVQGKSDGVRLWQQTMEQRRGPDGKDAFLGVRRG